MFDKPVSLINGKKYHPCAPMKVSCKIQLRRDSRSYRHYFISNKVTIKKDRNIWTEDWLSTHSRNLQE